MVYRRAGMAYGAIEELSPIFCVDMCIGMCIGTCMGVRQEVPLEEELCALEYIRLRVGRPELDECHPYKCLNVVTQCELHLLPSSAIQYQAVQATATNIDKPQGFSFFG